MEQILAATGQPGVSVGVLYHGQVVLNHSIGHRDAVAGIKADGDTLYCIGSLSKAFVTAALNALISENGLSWSDKAAKHVPDLYVRDDPTLADRLTLVDLVSHRSGLSSLDQLLQGLDSRILAPKDDVVRLMQELPVRSDIRSEFWYCNLPFSVVGRILEEKGGCGRWDKYLEKRILRPLGMHRTTADAETYTLDSNLAQPYVVLPDGSAEPLAQPEISSSTLHGCSGGIRSSVNDMLKWCHVILSATNTEHQDTPTQPVSQVFPHSSRLFESATIIDPASTVTGNYCLGWVRQTTPASLGAVAPNRTFSSPVLGKGSPSRLIYSHSGSVAGYTASLCVFPEEQAAIVAMANGTGLSDCTDWIMQDLAQAMFYFQPANDYVALAKQAADTCARRYQDRFVRPLQAHRLKDTERPPQSDFVGEYTRRSESDYKATAIGLSVVKDGKGDLMVVINGHVAQAYHLHHYHHDTWCLLPSSAEEATRRGYFGVFNEWEEFLVNFGRRSDGVIAWLTWKLDGIPVRFERVL